MTWKTAMTFREELARVLDAAASAMERQGARPQALADSPVVALPVDDAAELFQQAADLGLSEISVAVPAFRPGDADPQIAAFVHILQVVGADDAAVDLEDGTSLASALRVDCDVPPMRLRSGAVIRRSTWAFVRASARMADLDGWPAAARAMFASTPR